MSLKKHMNDQVTVKTMDGETYTNIAASVQRDMIITMRTDIPIRPGDQISRRTPAGVEEIFIVEDPGFHSGTSGIPATYLIRVRRAAPASTKSIVMATPETLYTKAFRLLDFIDKETRGKEEPIHLFNEVGLVEHKEIGLSEEDTIAAWQYLRQKNLIKNFKLKRAPYPALINGYGIDAIETARMNPDEPAKNFPSVTYNYINVQYMVGSTIQQSGAHANITKKGK